MQNAPAFRLQSTKTERQVRVCEFLNRTLFLHLPAEFVQRLDIGSFNRIARKYGIDFAPFKVKGEKRYMVFFKAPDADAMTAAFKEYTAKQVRKAERPSVLEKLQHFKSLIQAAVVDRTKRKELER